jgi:hypothetical protein
MEGGIILEYDINWDRDANAPVEGKEERCEGDRTMGTDSCEADGHVRCENCVSLTQEDFENNVIDTNLPEHKDKTLPWASQRGN